MRCKQDLEFQRGGKGHQTVLCALRPLHFSASLRLKNYRRERKVRKGRLWHNLHQSDTFFNKTEDFALFSRMP